jgi:2-polyprenyl-3-methyl-5-hydroxy-6-metoxy-1,4-benzoquinol methylase
MTNTRSPNDSIRSAAVRSATEEKAFYDDMWDRYSHLDAASPAAFHRRRLVIELATRYAADVSRLLDVGCGQGELLRDLTLRMPAALIAGSDLSERSLVDSRRRNPTFELFELDVADPQLPERHPARLRSFDLVTCCEVLEHIPDDQTAARNLASLLAPGGTLIATVPGGKMSRFDHAIGHQRHYRAEQLESLLTNAGLHVERVLAWGFPFHNIYRSAVRLASMFTMPGSGGESTPSQSAASRPGLLSSALSAGYVAFGRVLNPLFYLNADHGGEQMIAIARFPG